MNTVPIKPILSRDGHTYWVEEGDTLYEQRLRAGQYQKTNWEFAQTLIDEWHRCVDVGSNNACNAIHYAKRFDRVECYEPTLLAQQLWRNTIRDNHITNCDLHTHALGERDYSTDIVIHWKNGGHNHLNNADRPRWNGKTWGTRHSQPRKRQTQSVTVTRLDSQMWDRVGFIKIDVEGYEKFVLEGAADTIKRCRPTLQLEIVAGQCRKFGYWGEHMIDHIRQWDYVVVSKQRGILQGEFSSYRTELRYEGVKYRGEMDLYFQPRERLRPSKNSVFDRWFEQD